MKAQKSYVVVQLILSVTFLFCFATSYHIMIKNSSNDSEYSNGNSDSNKSDESYRLPNETLPLHYSIKIETNIHLSNDTDPAKFRFSGQETIRLQATDEVRNQIVLHADRLNIGESILTTTDSTLTVIKWENEEKPWQIDDVKQFLIFTIAADETLVKGQEYFLTINFDGVLETNNEGFYRSSYENEHGELVWLATTQYAPTFARRTFPCYDEPGIRATMQLEINHHVSLNVASNTPFQSTESLSDDRVLTTFQKTPKMQTYLLAFLISDFKSVSKQVEGLIPQTVYARTSAIKNRQCDFALDAGINTITALESYLNTSYSLPKLDQVALPDFGNNAMENWGLVNYREERLLYSETTTSLDSKFRIASVISHELGHQYFGNLVSIGWWKYVWMKEGFATFCEYFITNEVYPEFQALDMMIIEALQFTLRVDALETTRPMTKDGQSPTEISALYDDIAYKKSGSVIRMWQHALTDEVFRLGLKYYLDDRAYQFAETHHLVTAFERAANEVGTLSETVTVEEFINNWSTETGYPVLHVQRTAGHLYLTAQRFDYKGNRSECCQHWVLPLTMASASDPNFEDTRPKYWMKSRSFFITRGQHELKDTDWVIFNVQQTGFYRVDYEDDLWMLISQQLQTNASVIHRINRAQIVDDIFNLARANHVEYSLAFDLLSFLKTETDSLPWASADAGFEYLNRVLVDSEYYQPYLNFISSLVSNLYTTMGMQDRAGELLPQKISRNIAINLFCISGDETCLKETNDQMNKILETSNGDISPDLRQTIFCNGLRQASEVEYNKVIQRISSTKDQGVRSNLINALGCMSDPKLQEYYLGSSIAKTQNIYRAQERNRVLQAVYTFGGKSGLSTSIQFITANYTEIDLMYSTSASSTSPAKTATKKIADRVTKTSAESYKNLLETLEAVSLMTSEERVQILQVVQANIDWLELYEEKIGQYFKSGAQSLVINTLIFTGLFSLLFVLNF